MVKEPTVEYETLEINVVAVSAVFQYSFNTVV